MKIIFFIILLLSFNCFANEIKISSSGIEVSNDLEISVGAGYPYGSPILGIQIASKNEFVKTYISAGLVGFAIGSEMPISENRKHTLGFTAGAEFITSDEGFGFLTYSYHFNSFFNDGFVAGLGVGFVLEEIGYVDESDYWITSGEVDISPALTLILGYKF